MYIALSMHVSWYFIILRLSASEKHISLCSHGNDNLSNKHVTLGNAEQTNVPLHQY